ncbi:single-stranded DNA-binding protein [Xenorhabdus sp. XENO-10]|uniref:Single-stranded DNA-binding protein n=1 Tax=Xenorhabdus yunnanensis TaxID=3025878 RepID=A0ABT5LK93_9GAMM|nr:single-stranded DNA-binding protein [Xenorhabdus yunnanensis]MDC9591552.1 single-stranded DNA-binding protein [Xenorhabdus yunnanensis]
MANLNQCNFTGRIGNMEMRYSPNGMAIMVFSVAVNKSKKDANGQWIDQTTWLRCKAFKGTAEYIERNAQKGSLVRITAEYQEAKWQDKTGQDRSMPEFIVNDVEVLGNRKEQQGQGNQPPQQHSGQQQQSQFWGQQQTQTPAPQPEPPMNFDDDIPF